MPELGDILYNPRSGRYVWADSKRFVPRAVILNLVEQERQRTATRLQAHTRLMAGGRITLAEWQTRMAESLKDAHLRMGLLGSGGKDRIDQRQFGAIGWQLKNQFGYLDNFAKRLQQGTITAEQALRRSARYADSIKLSFHRSEQIARGVEGFNEAKRVLDSQAKHCASCLSYSTNGKWLPSDAVVLPGINCECGQFCKCQIYYRKRPGRRSPLSQPGILAG